MSAALKKIVRDHNLSSRLIPVFTLRPELELACGRVADFIGEKFMGDIGPTFVMQSLPCCGESSEQGRSLEKPATTHSILPPQSPLLKKIGIHR
jgi:hypothetical protein